MNTMAVFVCQYYLTADVPCASSLGGITFFGVPGAELWKGNI